jgi:hypothetical protein
MWTHEFGLKDYVTKFLLLGVNWGIVILFYNGSYIAKCDVNFTLDLDFYCILSKTAFIFATNLFPSKEIYEVLHKDCPQFPVYLHLQSASDNG